MKKIFISLLFLISAVSYSQIDTLDISRFLNAGNGRRQGSEMVKLKTFMLAVNGTNYFIAASNATATEKSIANVLCDGTSDQVQINAALTAGYNIKLSSGTFNVAAPVTASISNTIIEGTGKEKTIINLTTGSNCNVVEIGGNFWVIKDLRIDGNSVNNTGSKGISGVSMTNITIDNCEITDIIENGIFIRDASTYWNITDCYIYETDGGAIYSTCWGGDAPSYINVISCRFHNTAAESDISITGDPGTVSYNWNIDKCLLTGEVGYMGILSDKAQNTNITNCYFNLGLASGAGNPGAIRFYQGSSGIISGNNFNGVGGSTEGFTHINIWGGHDVVINNNNFTNTSVTRGQGIGIESYTVAYNTYNIDIVGNTFHNIGGIADAGTWHDINIYTANTYTTSNINISGNNFMDDRGASAYTGYGINMGGTAGGITKNINISNNIAEGLLYGFTQITISGDNVLIANNLIVDCPTGIIADDGDDLQIIGNKFVSCTTPIDVNDSDVTRPLVTENTMYGCTNSGTYAGATGELFGNNLWHDGTYDATAP